MRRLHRDCLPGNTLTEVGLVGGVVLVAAVGVMLLLGGNVERTMTALRGDLTQNVTSARTVEAARAVEAARRASLAEAMSSAEACGDGQCTADGALPTFTSGSNGSGRTAARAERILALAEEYNLNVEDPAWAALLRKVATSGHKLAAAEASIEAQCPTGRCSDDNKYLFHEMARAFQEFQANSDAWNEYFMANFSGKHSQYSDYYDLKSAVYREIGDIQDVKATYSWENDGDYVTYQGYRGDDGQMGSQETHSSSNNICARQPDLPACTRPQ